MDVLGPTFTNRRATIDGDVDNVAHVIKKVVDMGLRSICGKIGDKYRALVDFETIGAALPSESATGHSRFSRLERRTIALVNLSLEIPLVRIAELLYTQSMVISAKTEKYLTFKASRPLW